MNDVGLRSRECDEIGFAVRDNGEFAGAHGLVHAHPHVRHAAFERGQVAVLLRDLPLRQLRVGRRFVSLRKRHDRRTRPGGNRHRLRQRIARAHAERKGPLPHRHRRGELPAAARRHLHALGLAIGGEHFEFSAARVRTAKFHHDRLVVTLRQPTRVGGRFHDANFRARYALDVRHRQQGARELTGKLQGRHREHSGDDGEAAERRAHPHRDMRARQHDFHPQVPHPARDALLHQVAEGKRVVLPLRTFLRQLHRRDEMAAQAGPSLLHQHRELARGERPRQRPPRHQPKHKRRRRIPTEAQEPARRLRQHEKPVEPSDRRERHEQRDRRRTEAAHPHHARPPLREGAQALGNQRIERGRHDAAKLAPGTREGIQKWR